MRFFKRVACNIFLIGLFYWPALGYGEDLAAHIDASKPLPLAWPLECSVFEDCFIQNYPDFRMGTNPVSPVDYKCGRRTAPGLLGTEIAFADHNSSRNGQAVLAAAPGRVLFLVNSLPDSRRYAKRSKKACGNYIVIRHSDTHRTKYCHLRKGSAAVRVGAQVARAQKLAEVGSSGATEHPKLYFELQTNGTATDPFTGRVFAGPSDCFSLADKSQWAVDIPYPAAGVVAASFTSRRPTTAEIDFQAETLETLPSTVGTLSAWIKVFGVQRGDMETLEIYTPEEKLWHKAERFHSVDAPFWLAMVAAQPTKALQEGLWTSTYTLAREGQEVIHHTFSVLVGHPSDK